MSLMAMPLAGQTASLFSGTAVDPGRTHVSSDDRRPMASVAAGPGMEPWMWALFAAHPILGKLSEEDQRAVLDRARVRTLKRHASIFRQGDPPGTVVLILEGYVKLSTLWADGDAVCLEIAGPGACVGDLTVLLRRAHDTDITAASTCRLLMIDGRQFRQVFDRQPEGLLAILREVNIRLLRTTELLAAGRTLTATARLAKALLDLAHVPPTGVNSLACLPLRLSQSELGAMTGVCREVVNKLLGQWRDEGWIQTSAGAVLSIDIPGMSELVREEGDGGANLRTISG